MVAPLVVAAGITAAGGIASSLLGKKNKTQEPPEIVAARNLLLDYARTGKFGNFTAGEQVPLGYGDYTPTGVEQQGQSALQGLLQGGIPDQFKMGDAALMDYLKTNPTDVSAQFDPFKQQVERQIGESNQALKRTSAFGNTLYSTDTIKGLGDIQARGNETLTAELARLTNASLDRRLQAIPLAYQSGEAQQNVLQNQISASQQYGGLTRQLNDAQIKARDAELLRRRQELQLPITAAGAVLGGPSQPTIEQSPYAALLGTVGQIGGQYVGNELFLNQYKRFFPAATAPATA